VIRPETNILVHSSSWPKSLSMQPAFRSSALIGFAVCGGTLGFLALSLAEPGWQTAVAIIAPVVALVGLADKLMPPAITVKRHFSATVVDWMFLDVSDVKCETGDTAFSVRFTLKNLGDHISDLNSVYQNRFMLMNEGGSELMTGESTTFKLGPYPKSPFRIEIKVPYNTCAGRDSLTVIFTSDKKEGLISIK
jgi:hypothetical protein